MTRKISFARFLPRYKKPMKPLSSNDIESELSYAYLHAVASKAGASCNNVTRHQDNRGIDATLTAWIELQNEATAEVDLKIQLKSTTKVPSEQGEYWSYSLQGIDRYNDLRAKEVATPRILVVLFLPQNSTEWLSCTTEQLVLKRAAYWVSLCGAPPSNNDTAQTVYLPKSQLLTPDALLGIFKRLANKELLNYQLP
jgi:hypothetical protein